MQAGVSAKCQCGGTISFMSTSDGDEFVCSKCGKRAKQPSELIGSSYDGIQVVQRILAGQKATPQSNVVQVTNNAYQSLKALCEMLGDDLTPSKLIGLTVEVSTMLTNDSLVSFASKPQRPPPQPPASIDWDALRKSQKVIAQTKPATTKLVSSSVDGEDCVYTFTAQFTASDEDILNIVLKKAIGMIEKHGVHVGEWKLNPQ